MWTVSRDVEASADAVWHVLTDLEAWPQWGLSVARAELNGAAFELGATGRIWTPVGVPLPFVISELDQGRSWGWRVAGVPATRHGVQPRDDGSRVWMSAPLWAPGYLPVLAVALRRIEDMAAKYQTGQG
ncbi:SRPBCC family protein [Mycolicibacterium austroafricanum]|uniref:SRPBCC family protein n=1 Tax=Mycolicibacterium austroafricanum TaxID=39687 RepID=A0ABT8H8C0_MYCAO|nr:SRPBCC family protein [Mycolicibacterium austroafricanum]MDN4516512.1 SRPBCC family protein [Mycolicibacterium austroafricanum]PQP46337.1 polyketide cyclase [Mycolicibacterium austroafricanum]QRZ07162.1 SRPBCC family protein [Mycolicibacterium austroafricanum]QZT63041.1 SRPBCC family protein [Mycolicibacterium austroafricanum]QZT68647.1 SRPBCC family protein [Mycolicibacterium austroafricanum]